MLAITRPDGEQEKLVRYVTKSTGHHVFVRQTAAGKETRIASDTTRLALHKAVPQFWREALAFLANDVGYITLDRYRMRAGEIRTMKSGHRKTKEKKQRREEARTGWPF